MANRRHWLSTALAAALAPWIACKQQAFGQQKEDPRMYGIVGKLVAHPGQRDALIALLLEGTQQMPGCLSYIVSKDAADENLIWVTEVWDRQESHRASLSLPQVKETIGKARPLIAGGDRVGEMQPVGGIGLPSAAN